MSGAADGGVVPWRGAFGSGRRPTGSVVTMEVAPSGRLEPPRAFQMERAANLSVMKESNSVSSLGGRRPWCFLHFLRPHFPLA